MNHGRFTPQAYACGAFFCPEFISQAGLPDTRNSYTEKFI